LKEIVFLNKNVDRWKEFEALLEQKNANDPDLAADMFIQITDDLAYAQTYYKGSETVHYLNTLALKTHRTIYKTRKERKNTLTVFWKYTFPLEIFHSKKFILYSFIIMFISASIGWLSAANDDTYVRLIMGDGYVNMTLDNIEKGDPMAVYKSANEMGMFLGITINNIKVSFFAYLLSLFTSVGTASILFLNGVMLGSFQYFFLEHGVLYESILSIWIHGTLEIFAIVVAGGAGILAGNSILFPATYKRGTAFINGFVRGGKIVLGLMPIFIIAGALEGFVTRHTTWPDAVRIAIIVLSLAFIVWYFFLYPAKLAKAVKEDPELDKFIKSVGE